MPLQEFEKYRPPRHEPADFDAFWQDTLSDARTHAGAARFKPVGFLQSGVETLVVKIAVFAGQPIKGWLQLPKRHGGRIPLVISYIGYDGGWCLPIDWFL